MGSDSDGKVEDAFNERPENDSQFLSSNSDSQIGTCLAERYTLDSLLGKGGTGAVYKGKHLKMDRPVAIKLMHPYLATRPEALTSFCSEAKTAAALKHQNIVTLYDFGVSPANQPFLVMDYIDGMSLKHFIDTNGRVSFEHLQVILCQIIDGLAYAHSAGIIHQDLKPGNIMLSGAEMRRATIVDFGLAKFYAVNAELTGTGNKKKSFAGSPYYMSPEQCLSNAQIDARSDVYSLSILIYEALTGMLPFEKKSTLAMLNAHLHEMPKPFDHSNTEIFGIELCTELTKVFNKALEKDPIDRYKNVIEFGESLEEALGRDLIKIKAVKHRTVAAEQALVHASARSSQNNSLAINTSEAQLYNGSSFLSKQAEIEEQFLAKSDSNNKEQNTSNPVHQQNGVLSFIKKLSTTVKRDSVENLFTPVDAEEKISECPNCGTPLKHGIQFCLQCQRTPVIATQPTNLSEARIGNSFTSTKMTEFDKIEHMEAKAKLRSLRQPKKVAPITVIHRLIMYVLLAAIIIAAGLALWHYCLPNAATNSNVDQTTNQMLLNQNSKPAIIKHKH